MAPFLVARPDEGSRVTYSCRLDVLFPIGPLSGSGPGVPRGLLPFALGARYELWIIYLVDYDAARDHQRVHFRAPYQRVRLLDSGGSVHYPR
jgi:hypothetical protein